MLKIAAVFMDLFISIDSNIFVLTLNKFYTIFVSGFYLKHVFTECAKLRALRAPVPYVRSCLTCPRTLRALRALRALRDLVPCDPSRLL